MAPEKRSDILRWLPTALTVLSLIASIVWMAAKVDYAQGETARVQERERLRVDGLERTVRGISDGMQDLQNGMNEIRFNMRRDMNDRGVRYIETER